MPKTEFGVRLPVAGPLASPSAIVDISLAAEQLGFDCLWVHDYIAWTKELNSTHISCGSVELITPNQVPNFYESLTTLSFVAAKTQKIRIGTAVLIVPYRNPIVTAKQVANLDVLSNGRVTLGVGVGARRSTRNQDFEVLNVPREKKYGIFKEYIAAMKEIWTDYEPSFQGKYISFPKTEINPKPVQKPYPPIWVAGSSPKATNMVAEFGDGWIPTWQSPQQYEQRIREITETAEKFGRSGKQFTIADEIVTCVSANPEEARQISSKTVETLTAGFVVTSTEQAIASALIGSTDEVHNKVEAFVNSGVNHFEMKFIYQNIAQCIEQLRIFSEKVMPSFK